MGAMVHRQKRDRQPWRATVGHALRLSRQIFRGLGRRDLLYTALLLMIAAFSALAVVYATHLNRSLYATLSHLQEQRDAYQREWSQLLLEQSALSAHGRVERIASGSLEMRLPGREDIVVVRGEGH